MNARRLLPYLVALLLLAWILGSLARSGTEGGSILSNSYWLVYAVELLPLVALGLMVVLAVFLAVNWRLLSDALGTGMSRRRKQVKKANRTVQTIIFLTTWAVAGVLLLVRCRGLVCKSGDSAPDAAKIVSVFVSGPGPLPQLSFLGPALALANLVDTNVFALAFFGLAIVSSVIIVRAFKVHLDETRAEKVQEVELVQEQGREAVKDAIRLLDEEAEMDPRTRIMACYQRMIKAAADLGAPVGPDKTARELEEGIRGMFRLRGAGIGQLTVLFEEARYSLHPVTEGDAASARDFLLEISSELGGTVSLET